MKIKIIADHFNQEKFNQKAIHPLQSWQWGEARHEMGIKVLRIGEYSNNQITNVFQLTFHKIPFTNYKIGYLPRSVFPSQAVFNFLLDYGKKNNVIFVKIEPNELASFWGPRRDVGGLQNRSEQRFRIHPFRASLQDEPEGCVPPARRGPS